MKSESNSIPLAALETVFLDAGNTLISMDYEWIAAELAVAGVTVDAARVARAEAAARPATSRFVAALERQNSADSYLYYFARILEGLPGARELPPAGRDALCRNVAGRLRKPGRDNELWSRILPGVEDALAVMHAAGLKLCVVSNSDGSVERALADLGLGRFLHAVYDSEIVGYEKPDPRFFMHAMELAGARPGSTLHVGDMYFQDVVGARAAGIASVLLDPYGDWPDADCVRRPDLATLAGEVVAALSERQAGTS